MNKIIKNNKNLGIYDSLYLLVLYMPFHYIICGCLLSSSKIDNVFKDIVIIILFVNTLYNTKLKIGIYDAIIVVNWLVLLIFALCSIIRNNYPGILNIFRTYLIPQLMFIICSRIKINDRQYSKINKLVVVELAIIAIYGVFQAFVLGDKFLIKIGYPINGSYYISGFFGNQRSVGTFISPSICGVILAIGICCYLYSNELNLKRKKSIFSFLLIGLLATFSRSAMVGLLFTTIIITFLSGKTIHITRKMFVTGVGSLVVGCLVIMYIDYQFLGGIFADMIMRSWTSVLNKTDPSAKAHFEDLFQPMSTILSHPFGLGFGNNGPMASELSNNANLVESSFYLMVYELGIVFGIAFFIPYYFVIIDTFRNKKYKNYLPAAISMVVCFTYILLPNVQTYEILFYSFMYMGFYYNPYVMNIFNKRRFKINERISIRYYSDI